MNKWVLAMLIVIATTHLSWATNTYQDTETFQNLEFPSLKLDYYTDKSYNSLNILSSVSYQNWEEVPGAYSIEFVGIHEMILNQVKKKIQRQAEDDLRREWNLSNMSYSEFKTRMNRIDDEYNPYGSWWERPWHYSLPPEKGGAPKQQIVETIGWDIQITENTPLLGWLKLQFNKLGDIWISADHEFDEESGKSIDRNDRKNENYLRKDLNQIKLEQADLGIERPWRWFEDDFYHLRFKPTLKLATNSSTTFIEELALKIQTELYYGYQRKEFGLLGLFIKHDLTDNNTFFSIVFEFTSF